MPTGDRTQQWERIANNQKKCSRCGEIKPLTEFGRRPNSRAGFLSACKLCHAERHLRSRYGMTRAEVETLAEAQGGCAICGILEPADGWQVDHDHETGEVRGILCRPCNMGLGLFRDDPHSLAQAISYLAAHGG